jgi:hypothetical protein
MRSRWAQTQQALVQEVMVQQVLMQQVLVQEATRQPRRGRRRSPLLSPFDRDPRSTA